MLGRVLVAHESVEEGVGPRCHTRSLVDLQRGKGGPHFVGSDGDGVDLLLMSGGRQSIFGGVPARMQGSDGIDEGVGVVSGVESRVIRSALNEKLECVPLAPFHLDHVEDSVEGGINGG